MDAVASTCANLTYIDTLKRTRDCDVECNYLLDGGRIDHLHNTRCQELCPVCYDAIVAARRSFSEVMSTFLSTTPAPTGQGASSEPTWAYVLAGSVFGATILTYLGYQLYKKCRNKCRLSYDVEAMKVIIMQRAPDTARNASDTQEEQEDEDEENIRLFPSVPEDTAEAMTPQGATSSAEEHVQPEDLAQASTPQGAKVPPVEVVDKNKLQRDVLSDDHFH